MIMSNFIDESERHAELYQTYTSRQETIMKIVNGSKTVGNDGADVLSQLHTNRVSESEIHWLKRTGHFLPAYG